LSNVIFYFIYGLFTRQETLYLFEDYFILTNVNLKQSTKNILN